MPVWPFTRRRRARVPEPSVRPLFDGSFAWESPAYAQRRRDRVQDLRREVDAMVAERTEHHPRARAAYDGVIAGWTTAWHLDDDAEHTRSLARLRGLQTEAEVTVRRTATKLREAQDARRLAEHNWRDAYVRLGGEPQDVPVEPDELLEPEPDDVLWQASARPELPPASGGPTTRGAPRPEQEEGR